MRLGRGFVLAAAMALAGMSGAAGAAAGDASKVAFALKMSDDELSAVSGGSGDQILTVTTQTVNADSNGNSINAGTVNTGQVSINANALSGFNGIGNFVINTGNNNVVQGTLSVTVVSPGVP